MARMKQQLGATPSVVASFRPIRGDINPRITQLVNVAANQLARTNQSIVAEQDGVSLNPLEQAVFKIRDNSEIEASLKLIQLGFQCRVIDLVANTRQQIIEPAKKPRGYIIINPAEVTGFSSIITLLPSLNRAAAAYNSSSFNVSGVDTARLFLSVTATAGGTLLVDTETQDPLSLGWATSQNDIFGGSAAVGTYYADIGSRGVDKNFRIEATVGAANVTFSISAVLKGAALTPQGSTIYIGNSDVTSFIGYPVLAGQRDYFYLAENVALYAISPNEPVTLKVFQLS